MTYTVTVLVAAAASSVLLTILYRIFHLHKTVEIILKCVAVAYVALIIARFCFNDAFLKIIKGKEGALPTNYLQSFLRWGQYTSYTVLAVAVFRKSRTIRNFCIYVCLPVAVINAFFYTDNLQYLLNPVGVARYLPEGAAAALWSAELIIAIAVPLTMRLCGIHRFNLTNKKEWLNFGVAVPLLLILLMPSYLPQSLVGHTGLMVSHKLLAGRWLWLATMPLVTLLLYNHFKHSDYETRYTVCCLFALMLLIHFYSYTQVLSSLLYIIPLQLCHLASVLFILLMVGKNRTVYVFVFAANLIGTIIGSTGGDTGPLPFTTFTVVRYVYQHEAVFILAILVHAFRLFPRFEVKDIYRLAAAMGIYWLVCLVLGTYVKTNYYTMNWFYMFDVNHAMRLFPHMRYAYEYTWVIGKNAAGKPYELYPLFQLFAYCFYTLVCGAFILITRGTCARYSSPVWRRERMFAAIEKVNLKVKIDRSLFD